MDQYDGFWYEIGAGEWGRPTHNRGSSIMNRIRLGLIGLGEWPRQAYLPVLKDLENVEILAVAARSSASRQYARQQLGEQVVLYADYRDLLASAAVEAVTLALPNPLHAEALEAALSAGKHLFTNRPSPTAPRRSRASSPPWPLRIA